MWRLAYRSLRNRLGTALLVVLAIAAATALAIGVERVRSQARDSFTNTLYGTDLVVGARTGPISLLLYSVFRIGDATNNVRYASYKQFAAHPDVAWTIPLSLGDSHRGFRVLGTNDDYLRHYRYGNASALRVEQGRWIGNRAAARAKEAVLGAAVAERLRYRLGQRIVLAHGVGDVSFTEHDDHPFTVVGILQRTGTPVDHTVHVDLAGIEAMHAGFLGGMASRFLRIQRSEPATITAFLVGLHSRTAIFAVQRDINEYDAEPLLAILPGLTLQQLWDLVGLAENALRLVAAFVVVVAFLVMVVALVTSLAERRREMAILRALGAGPRHILVLVLGEALLATLLGAVLGVLAVQLGTIMAAGWIEAEYGLRFRVWPIAPGEWTLVATTLGAGLVAGIVPAWLAYRQSVADGMTVRL